MKQIFFALAFSLFTLLSSAQVNTEWPTNNRPMPQWYANAKFGIFIHWGVYSVPSWATNSYADGFGSNYAEWYWQRLSTPSLKIHKEFQDFHNKTYGSNSNYQDFAHQFKAELFDPKQWAKVFKNSGAKYVVLTSKHHDGFCLWDSKQSWNWNAVSIGPKRNLLKDLTDAVKAENIKMGYYYSLYEWYNPLYLKNIETYVNERMIPQLKDLTTNYKPDILWTDGEWEKSAEVWKSKEFLKWLFTESPIKDSIIVNDRWGGGSKGKLRNVIQTSEYGHGTVSTNQVWEETRGIGQSFGYNRNENLEHYASSKDLIHQLITVVSKGGNFLLNIGPAADGSIPVIMQQRLADMGTWLHINGEAIYNTTGNVFDSTTVQDSTIYFTKNKNTTYAIATSWKKQYTIKGVQKPTAVTLVGTKEKVKFVYKNKTLTITAPLLTPDINPSTVAWVYKISNEY